MYNYNFSFKEYEKIIKKYKEYFIDYADIKNKDSFVLLRHDVEFSPTNALDIAQIEYSYGVNSSFLFQVNSNAYNILSIKNRRIIKNVMDLGHKVGLHFFCNHIRKNDWESLEKNLIEQKQIINNILDYKCERFSYHRPPDWVLTKRDDEICGMINMYGKSFFEFKKKPKHIKYLADSNHLFKYGHPLDEIDFKKIQILLHPDEWSPSGNNALQTFRTLEKMHLTEFYKTLNQESRIYMKNLPLEVENEDSSFWE